LRRLPSPPHEKEDHYGYYDDHHDDEKNHQHNTDDPKPTGRSHARLVLSLGNRLLAALNQAVNL
jgi:hypothetical protein